MQKTIDNMLNTLDRWTEYIPESDIEEYRERTITGDYGGIGSRIRKIDDIAPNLNCKSSPQSLINNLLLSAFLRRVGGMSRRL